ncbi:MAG: hypothetical protein ACFFC7_34120 [Candidatus Hermodarchaeota archaeon]
MNKKIYIFSSLLVVFLLILPMASVSADKPEKFIDVSGTISISVQATQIPSLAGKSGNLKLEFVGGEVLWSGGIAGEAVYTGSRWVLTKNVMTAYNLYTFDEATVDEKTGGLCILMTANNKGSPISHWRILYGTGDLAGIHGVGTFALFVGYTGQVHFGP